jgi:hypothetical protein
MTTSTRHAASTLLCVGESERVTAGGPPRDQHGLDRPSGNGWSDRSDVAQLKLPRQERPVPRLCRASRPISRATFGGSESATGTRTKAGSAADCQGRLSAASRLPRPNEPLTAAFGHTQSRSLGRAISRMQVSGVCPELPALRVSRSCRRPTSRPRLASVPRGTPFSTSGTWAIEEAD